MILPVLMVIFTVNTQAKIWLPTIISDNMVLQRNSSPVIWGWTTHHPEKISITCSWDNVELKTQANQGRWAVSVVTPEAGGPYTITIQGEEEVITLSNILIGDVWLCSGQSNMAMTPARGIHNAEEEIAAANYPKMRLFTIPKRVSPHPQDDTPGNWELCTPESMKDFSAVAYFFGHELHKKLDVPIGLVHSSYGGSAIEAWIPGEVLKSDVSHMLSLREITRTRWPKDPAFAFNAMIYPIVQFDITGVIWYQGESNLQNANTYYHSFPRLIASWRAYWNKNFPFYYVQIAPYKYGTIQDAAIVRDAQLQTLKRTNNTGMVVTNDIGNPENIHPENKQEVGRRLALWALSETYGVADITCSGPLYDFMTISKQEVTLHFNHAEDGLIMKGDKLNGFKIAGPDKVFHPATAKIKGSMVVVRSDKVENPEAVRFAFTNTAIHNLFNRAGLPASPFRTDNWSVEEK